MIAYREEHLDLSLNDINLLHAEPSAGEVRATWMVMGVLLVGCLVTLPFAARQWPTSHLLYTAAGIAAFSEITTGVLLLTQAILLRQDSGLALGLGYLVGGLVIVVNSFGAKDIATRLWLFRLWHGVFVFGVLLYAIFHSRPRRRGFQARFRRAIGASALFLAAVILYLIFRPFPLPVIIRNGDYATLPNVLVNGVQLVIVSWAWWLLVTARRRTVLSVWMAVVALAVAIDIILFVLGTTLFSVGLYISKLNNLLAATLIFVVIFYRYIRIQRELHQHRVVLVQANRKLARMAMTDPLTGLPNRAALEQTLDTALARVDRASTQLAVCVLDLDDFKPVNDLYGHEAGDRLLRAFASRVSAILRKGEYFARLGGDEFVLILEGIEGMDSLPTILERITGAIASPFFLEPDLELTVEASIGVAVYPACGSASELMRAADQALYHVKGQKGRRGATWSMGIPETQEGGAPQFSG